MSPTIAAYERASCTSRRRSKRFARSGCGFARFLTLGSIGLAPCSSSCTHTAEASALQSGINAPSAPAERNILESASTSDRRMAVASARW
eukprot:2738766-Prymnesium_polylepis.1